MPYIKIARRLALTTFTEQLKQEAKLNGLVSGDCVYLITHILNTYLAQRSANFADMATALGMLESAKLEIYRRTFAPYEDGKRKENGDVYG